MGQGRLERLAPLTGVVFFVLIVVLLLTSGETPDTDDSTREIVQFWKENETEQMLVSAGGVISSVFLLWFAASLRDALWQAEGGSGRLAALSFGGAVLAVSGMMILFGLNFAVAESADDAPASAVHALSTLNNGLFFPFIGGFGVFMFASGLAALRTRALPAVAAWIAIVVGLVSFTPVGFFAFLVAVIWVAVVGVMLYRRSARPTAAAPVPPRSAAA